MPVVTNSARPASLIRSSGCVARISRQLAVKLTSIVSLNAGLGRNFTLGERKILNIRMEANNLTNRVSYTRIGTTVNASDYGLATGVSGMRNMQLNVRFSF